MTDSKLNKTIERLKYLAENGDVEAAEWLGCHYLDRYYEKNHVLTESDETTEALKWFERAAELGSDDAAEVVDMMRDTMALREVLLGWMDGSERD